MSRNPSSHRNEPGPYRPRASATGIRADELLPLHALHERLGWGPRTISKAQREGLRVLGYAKWKYVRGCDVTDFLVRAQANSGDRPEAEQHPERSAV